MAPETAREIGRVVEARGARFVDGGIIGPATRGPGAARIYLAGPAAPEVASLLGAGALDAIVLDASAGAASALKMAFAGWSKGSQALLAAVRAFAIAEGVDQALLAAWFPARGGARRSALEVPQSGRRSLVADSSRVGGASL